MFYEAIANRFAIDDLNKDLCYQFILIHHLNKNIVTYSDLGRVYKQVVHLRTIEKYTNRVVKYTINDQLLTPQQLEFETVDQLQTELARLSEADAKAHHVSTEGVVVEVYKTPAKQQLVGLIKLQTELYQKLNSMKPNNSNIHQSYLELYQNDRLNDFLVYFNGNKGDIIKRINTAMRHMATEILNLYHGTRKKKNPEVYTRLPDSYRKTLYGLHGRYISHKKEVGEHSVKSGSITVHDVYFYLKEMPADKLRQLFYERWEMITNGTAEPKFFNSNDIPIKIQTLLMFRYLIEKRQQQKQNKQGQKLAVKKME